MPYRSPGEPFSPFETVLLTVALLGSSVGTLVGALLEDLQVTSYSLGALCATMVVMMLVAILRAPD